MRSLNLWLALLQPRQSCQPITPRGRISFSTSRADRSVRAYFLICALSANSSSDWLDSMKTVIVVASFAILASSFDIHAQTPSDADRAWILALDRLEQRERTGDKLYAVASIERSVQRRGEEELTVVTKATAKIWRDDPKYRVEIENELSMQSLKLGTPYTSTGIRKQTIAFDGTAVRVAIDRDNGERTGIDYGRNFALPLMFAGFPSPDPIRLWTFDLRVDRLQGKEFNCMYLNSGMIRVQSKEEANPRNPNRRCFYLLPESHEIRRYELRDSSKKHIYTLDLTWHNLNGTVFLKRFVRNGSRGSSQFPGGSFQDKRIIELSDFQTDVAISDEWFSRDSLGDDRRWIERGGGY